MANKLNLMVSVSLPKRAGVYTQRGGGLSTQVAEVTVDIGPAVIDAVLYGRLTTSNGRPAVTYDLAAGKGVRFDPAVVGEVNAAVEAAAKSNPHWSMMERKAFDRLMSGQTVEKSKIGLADFTINEPKLVTPEPTPTAAFTSEPHGKASKATASK